MLDMSNNLLGRSKCLVNRKSRECILSKKEIVMGLDVIVQSLDKRLY